MISIKKLTIFVASCVLTIAVLDGCTKYADLDDLEKLEEAKQAAISAEAELNQTKAEEKRLSGEIKALKLELKEVEEEREVVKRRVAAAGAGSE